MEYRLDEKIMVWGQLKFEIPDDSFITEEELKQVARKGISSMIDFLESKNITPEYEVNLDTEEELLIEDNNLNPTVELHQMPISGQYKKPLCTNIEGTPWEEEYNKRMSDN